MTQIGLELFNKLPFARNDIYWEPFEGGRPGKRRHTSR